MPPDPKNAKRNIKKLKCPLAPWGRRMDLEVLPLRGGREASCTSCPLEAQTLAAAVATAMEGLDATTFDLTLLTVIFLSSV